MNVFEAALDYARKGYSVIPLVGKIAAFAWTRYQTERATYKQVAQWFIAENRNVGIVCGGVSNLVVIDLDSAEAVERFRQTFPDWLDTKTIKTGRGLHLYFSPYMIPQNARRGGIEIRGNGQYVVAPPSIHPTTLQPYEVIHNAPVKAVHNLLRIEEWLAGAKPAAKTMPTISVKDSTRYGQSALASECQRLARTQPGAQNDQLNLSAFRMGQLVAKGHMSESEAAQALLSVALSIGQPEKQSLRTIESGLRAGKSKSHDRHSA